MVSKTSPFSPPYPESAPRLISARDAYNRTTLRQAVLVDVREPAEWRTGIAKGARLLPLGELTLPSARWEQFLRENADKEIIVYCASGMRSSIAVNHLVKNGYQAANMGGLGAWVQTGLPLAQPE